ncbi:MAG: hypothetical protein U5M50_06355 [Sphingobium sp.]|nr:hypothetical protein [Sphingobium sp.]
MILEGADVVDGGVSRACWKGAAENDRFNALIVERRDAARSDAAVLPRASIGTACARAGAPMA